MSQKSTLLTYRLDSSILVLLSNDVFYEIFNTVYSNIFVNFLIIIIMLIISILPFWQILILLCIAGHSLIDTYLISYAVWSTHWVNSLVHLHCLSSILPNTVETKKCTIRLNFHFFCGVDEIY